jgi:adenylate cyclase
LGIEIEKKFLVIKENWRMDRQGVLYRQGYLSTDKERTVRVRQGGDSGYITIKSRTENGQRREFEYTIPHDDAQYMLDKLCDKPLIEKIRYKIEYAGLIWEVDEFLAENRGLIIAEVELTSSEQEIVLPDWVGDEVTDNAAYYNVNLVKNPYRNW